MMSIVQTNSVESSGCGWSQKIQTFSCSFPTWNWMQHSKQQVPGDGWNLRQMKGSIQEGANSHFVHFEKTAAKVFAVLLFAHSR